MGKLLQFFSFGWFNIHIEGKSEVLNMAVNSINGIQEVQTKKGATPLGTGAALASGAGLGAGAYMISGGGLNINHAKKLLEGGVDAFVNSKMSSDTSQAFYLMNKAQDLKLSSKEAVNYVYDNVAKLPDILKEDFKKFTEVTKHSKGKIAAYVAVGAALIGGAYLLIKNHNKNKAEQQ